MSEKFIISRIIMASNVGTNIFWSMVPFQLIIPYKGTNAAQGGDEWINA